MIEIRTYDGDAQELATFCGRVWRGYLEGREQFALWDDRFFDWQLLAPRPGGRDYLVAAYDGSKLVGVLMGEAFQFRLTDRVVDASTSSWLTVDPEHRGVGLGIELIEELLQRHRDRGAPFTLGFVVGGDKTGAARFWNAYERARPEVVRRLGSIGGWARALNRSGMIDGALDGKNRFLARVLAALSRAPLVVASPSVRPYQTGDLDACAAMVQRSSANTDLGLVWTAERLALQLEPGELPRTLVYSRAGTPAGFINYYALSLCARRVSPIGVIDFAITAEMSVQEARELLDTACASMRDEGCVLAFALRLPAWRASHMLAAGFVPLPADNAVVAVMADPACPLPIVRRPFLHLR